MENKEMNEWICVCVCVCFFALAHMHAGMQARIYARAPGARAQGGKFSGAAY